MDPFSWIQVSAQDNFNQLVLKDPLIVIILSISPEDKGKKGNVKTSWYSGRKLAFGYPSHLQVFK